MTLSFTQTFLSTTFIVGIAVFVLMACSAFLGYAVGTQKKSLYRPILLLGGIALWFSVAIATSTAGLIGFDLVLPFAILPIIGGALLSYTPMIKGLLKQIPTHWFVFLQTYRVAGAIFIFPYMTEGILTRGFALNAGIGDILTGVLAFPVAWLIMRHGRRYKWLFFAWSAFGILDLIVAPASAAYYGFSTAEALFPITAIPLFLGPPLGILLHIITLRSFNLRFGEVHISKSTAAQNLASRV
ncbi:MAG: hypothetical protein QNJ45_13850 [Ardenticatenaceae bacterium]|nr:hypothetical protein [Ardenticatenaceae bacterium]